MCLDAIDLEQVYKSSKGFYVCVLKVGTFYCQHDLEPVHHSSYVLKTKLIKLTTTESTIC